MHKWVAGLVVVTLGAITACGDNSRDCGKGTVEENGHCLPGATCGFGTRVDDATGQCVPDGSVVCTGGTVFDPLTGSCKLDPAVCQNGTVLVNGACVDPTGALVVDVQEGPEPNGLGIIEASTAQAGNIMLKGQGGDAFVIHGTIAPFRDTNADGLMDPDVDTYELTTSFPVYLHITADGVGGTAAGFVAVAEVDADDPLADWERVGLSLVSDTSVREVFLPTAGTYRIAIADTRTLLEYVTSGTATAAPGGTTSEYYVSIKQDTPPTPMDLALTNGSATLSGTLASDQLAVYRVALGNGLNSVQLAMPSDLATAAFVVTNNDMFAGAAQETASGPARTRVGAVTPGDDTLIVIDQAYTLLPSAAAFTLTVRASSSTPLPVAGGSASQPARTTPGTDFTSLDLWSFAVTAANTTLGIDLAWNQPVVGEIYDESGTLAASFTPPSTGVTWSSYRGLVRLPAAGTYYLAVYSPAGGTLTATSTLEELTPTVLTEGTPAPATVNPYRAVPFVYAAGADAWQQFDATGTNTGGQSVSWFDPTVAYGRLDSLVTSAGTLGPEVPPIFSHTYPTGGGAFGRVLLSDGTQAYYVKANAVAPTAGATLTLSAAPRAAATDLGMLATGTTTTRTAQSIDGTTPQRFYLFRAAPGSSVTITVTPTSNVNTQFRRLRADETALGALINTSTNGADVETYTVGPEGWTAFVVSSAGNLSGARTFDVAIRIQ